MFSKIFPFLVFAVFCASAKEVLLPCINGGWAVVWDNNEKLVKIDSALYASGMFMQKIEQKTEIIALVPDYKEGMPKKLIIAAAVTGNPQFEKKYGYEKTYSLFPTKYASGIFMQKNGEKVEIKPWQEKVWPIETLLFVIAAIVAGATLAMFRRFRSGKTLFGGIFLSLTVYICGLLLLPGNTCSYWQNVLMAGAIFGAFFSILLLAIFFCVNVVFNLLSIAEKKFPDDGELILYVVELIPLMAIIPFLLCRQVSMLFPTFLIWAAGFSAAHITNFLLKPKPEEEKTEQ